MTCLNAEPNPLIDFIAEGGDDTISGVSVSSTSIGDLGLSRLLAGLLSASILPLPPLCPLLCLNRDERCCRADDCGLVDAAEGDVVAEEGEDAVGPEPADAAAFINKCCLIPGLRPNNVGAKGASTPGGDGFINPLM